MATHGPYLENEDIERYHRIIEHLDTLMGVFRQRLIKEQEWQNTVLVVTSDHGEALGEHGMYAHAQALYEEQTAVPLFIHFPDRSPRVEDQVLSLGRLPSVLFEALGSRWPVAPPILKDYADAGPAIMQEHYLGRRLDSRAIRSEQWSWHHLYVRDVIELYRATEDPWETKDLSRQFPQVVEHFRQQEIVFEKDL